MNAPDRYDIAYADKLWNLLPAIYRTEDTDQFGVNGPLREMVVRIGAQAAILRRSIDRLWEDQSIETCDDWVIPYIGSLLDTNLVANLDGRGQRLDVANTIAYRLRKGTVSIVEEIAANITGWDARAIEFFRRLGRTRHGLDPAIGPRVAAADPVGTLQIAEGLVGPVTRTPIGGFADLRNAYGASKAHTAFDEFFHTADVRIGLGRFGWYDIPKLGVFVWRLRSFAVGPVTPVAVTGCPGWYTFDPTGRDVPLFAKARSLDAYGDAWVSPQEGQLATPIPQALLDADVAQGILDGQLPPAQQRSLDLYPNVVSVWIDSDSTDLALVAATELRLRPTLGRFACAASPPGMPLVANYAYGFPSQIGAGPYDRRLGSVFIAQPAPVRTVSGGGAALAVAGAIPSTGTLTIADSLTYDGAGAIVVAGDLTLRADNLQRPLLRLAGNAPLTITGQSGARLTLDGIFVSGADIILRGSFACVTLNCCTLDPGSAAAATPIAEGAIAQSPPAELFASAADGRELVPTRLWVEAGVTTMTLERCVSGPIRTRAGGTIEALSISNGIVQAIRTSGYGPLDVADVKDPVRFARRVQVGLDPVSAMLLRREPEISWLLGGDASPPLADSPPSPADIPQLVALIDEIIAGPSMFDPTTFCGVPLSADTRALQTLSNSSPAAIPAFNRALLEDAFVLELSDAALALADGAVKISRCTILGRIAAHRLEASESILQGLAVVDDTQDGCVRFCAYASNSIAPRRFESVSIADYAPLFTSVDFGRPAYAQLLPLVDAAIRRPATAAGKPTNTISAGATDGSEMGAYARDKNPIKANALAIKLQEYLPAALAPVIVMVT